MVEGDLVTVLAQQGGHGADALHVPAALDDADLLVRVRVDLDLVVGVDEEDLHDGGPPGSAAGRARRPGM